LSSRKEKIKWYEGEISDQADRDQKQSDFIVQWSVTHSEQFEVYEKTHTENIKTGTRNGTVASRTEIDSGAIVLTIIVAKKKTIGNSNTAGSRRQRSIKNAQNI